jgi:hypothetical protein
MCKMIFIIIKFDQLLFVFVCVCTEQQTFFFFILFLSLLCFFHERKTLFEP